MTHDGKTFMEISELGKSSSITCTAKACFVPHNTASVTTPHPTGALQGLCREQAQGPLQTNY